MKKEVNYVYPVNNGLAIQKVLAAKVDLGYPIEAYVFKSTGWTVIEFSTGMALGSSTTRKEAISRAKRNIDMHSLAVTQNLIKKFITKYGVQNELQSKDPTESICS